MSPASFSDPETHYRLEKSNTPVTVDGFALGEPTGMVMCEECGREAENVDEIPHASDCPQRFVKSHWWEHMFENGDNDD